MIKICAGIIIWNKTSPNISSRPLKCSLAKAYPARFAVGYGDTFTFSKAFKRHFGHSPSSYRS